MYNYTPYADFKQRFAHHFFLRKRCLAVLLQGYTTTGGASFQHSFSYTFKSRFAVLVKPP